MDYLFNCCFTYRLPFIPFDLHCFSLLQLEKNGKLIRQWNRRILVDLIGLTKNYRVTFQLSPFFIFLCQENKHSDLPHESKNILTTFQVRGKIEGLKKQSVPRNKSRLVSTYRDWFYESKVTFQMSAASKRISRVYQTV